MTAGAILGTAYGAGIHGAVSGDVLPTFGSTGLVSGPAYGGTGVGMSGAENGVTSSAAVQITAARTLFGIVRRTAATDAIFVACGGDAYLRILATGAVVVSWVDAGGVQRTAQSAANAIPADGVRRVVVGWHDGVTTAGIDVDGVNVVTSALYSCRLQPAGTVWRFGSLNGASFFLTGVMGPAGFYTRLLSTTERASLSAAASDDFLRRALELGPAGLWPCDDTTTTLRALAGPAGTWSGTALGFGAASGVPAVVADTDTAVLFDGVDRTVDQAIAITMPGGGASAFAFSCLFRLDALAPVGKVSTLFNWRAQAAGTPYHWLYASQLSGLLTWQFSDGAAVRVVTLSLVPVLGRAYLLDFCHDYAGRRLHVWADGVRIANIDVSAYAVPSAIAAGFASYLGVYQNSNNWFTGSIDEVAIRLDAVTTDAEAAALQASRIRGTFPATMRSRAPLLWHRLGEPAGSTTTVDELSRPSWALEARPASVTLQGVQIAQLVEWDSVRAVDDATGNGELALRYKVPLGSDVPTRPAAYTDVEFHDLALGSWDFSGVVLGSTLTEVADGTWVTLKAAGYGKLLDLVQQWRKARAGVGTTAYYELEADVVAERIMAAIPLPLPIESRPSYAGDGAFFRVDPSAGIKYFGYGSGRAAIDDFLSGLAVGSVSWGDYFWTITSRPTYVAHVTPERTIRFAKLTDQRGSMTAPVVLTSLRPEDSPAGAVGFVPSFEDDFTRREAVVRFDDTEPTGGDQTRVVARFTASTNGYAIGVGSISDADFGDDGWSDVVADEYFQAAGDASAGGGGRVVGPYAFRVGQLVRVITRSRGDAWYVITAVETSFRPGYDAATGARIRDTRITFAGARRTLAKSLGKVLPAGAWQSL